MEVTRIQPQKPPLQQLFRVTFASVVFLLVVSIWAIVNYCQDEANQMAQMHTTMQPTYKYFDTNRALAPISDLMIVSDGDNGDNTHTMPTCDAQHELQTIYTWEGNNAGYKTASGTYFTGTAPTSAGTTTPVSTHSAVTAKLFNNVGFCVKRMLTSSLTLVSSSSQACASKQIHCSECHCSTAAASTTALQWGDTTGDNDLTPSTANLKSYTKMNSICPLDTFNIVDTNPSGTGQITDTNGACNAMTNNAGQTLWKPSNTAYGQCTWAGVTSNSWLVGFSVQLFGQPCMDPSMHGTATANGWTALLADSYTGCGSFGVDPYSKPVWTTIANSYYLNSFVNDNSQFLTTNTLGSTLFGVMNGASSQAVSLWTQHRIEMSCSSTCQGYSMTNTMTNMNTQMAAAYSDLKVIIYITAIGGGLCMMWCAYLVWRRSEATQEEYLQFWGATLLVLVVTCILLALFISSMSSSYQANRATLPEIANCITNTQWKQLPTQIYSLSSMDSEHNWAITFLTLGVVLALAMAYFMMTVSQQLEQMNRPQDMPMY